MLSIFKIIMTPHIHCLFFSNNLFDDLLFFEIYKIMKYKKLVANIFAQNAKNNAQVGFALVAGLAVGAALAILFAPESGTDTRRGISNRARNLGEDAKDLYGSLRSRLVGSSDAPEADDREVQPVSRSNVKKPKSDIKELIHEAHVNGAHTEQNIS